MRVRLPGIEAADQQFTIRYGDIPVDAQRGDTVAAALIAAGHYHCRKGVDSDPRGVFCGMGACGECSMVIDGAPGVLACMTKAQPDMRVEVQPHAAPPAAAAGHNAVDSTAREQRERAPTVLVIGGGAAGLAAAAHLAEAGLDVLLVDERADLGGQFYKQPATGRSLDPDRLDSQFAKGRSLIERARSAGVELVGGTTVWGAFAPNLFVAHGGGIGWTFRPERVVVATGARERSVPFPGWTLPGVMMTGAAQTLLRSTQVTPGNRVLVAGNGPLNMQVAAELLGAGTDVAALVESADLRATRHLGVGLAMALSAPGIVRRGATYRTSLMRRRVPVIDRAVIVGCEGDGRVEQATIASIDGDGEPIANSERQFDVDSVCVGYGFISSDEITTALGCAAHVDPRTGDRTVTTSRHGRTSHPSVWAIGDASGIRGAYVAQAMGALAAADILASLGQPNPASRPATMRRELSHRRQVAFQRSLWQLYGYQRRSIGLAQPDTLICRCESVTRIAVESCFADGVASLGAVKRLTRAGMGRCQGRYCASSLEALHKAATGKAPDAHSGFAPQPPIRPTMIGQIAAYAVAGQSGSASTPVHATVESAPPDRRQQPNSQHHLEDSGESDD